MENSDNKNEVAKEEVLDAVYKIFRAIENDKIKVTDWSISRAAFEDWDGSIVQDEECFLRVTFTPPKKAK